jgi:hypothetical protein
MHVTNLVARSVENSFPIADGNFSHRLVDFIFIFFWSKIKLCHPLPIIFVCLYFEVGIDNTSFVPSIISCGMAKFVDVQGIPSTVVASSFHPHVFIMCSSFASSIKMPSPWPCGRHLWSHNSGYDTTYAVLLLFVVVHRCYTVENKVTRLVLWKQMDVLSLSHPCRDKAGLLHLAAVCFTTDLYTLY